MAESIKDFLDKDELKGQLRLLTAGSVDDGKSTLIGRLLYDSKKLYDDQLSTLERESKRIGNAGEGEIDYALLLDGLKAEREQGITIDVAYRYFSTNKRKFIIADTPGHEQYTRNMITGGSTADLAIILVDARQGIITQTKRHTYLTSLLGIRHIVLAVNKMDLVNFSQKIFDEIVAEYLRFVSKLNYNQPPVIQPIPLSALKGDNVVDLSLRTPWYEGKCLLDYLETVDAKPVVALNHFRFPIQYVLRPNLDFRGFSGKVISGLIHPGDKVMALPSRKTSTVKEIVTYDGALDIAFPPQSITLTLTDEIDISRGEMLVPIHDLPLQDRDIKAHLVWMDEKKMDLSKHYYLKHTTNTTRCEIRSIISRIDVNTLELLEGAPLSLNEIAEVRIQTAKEIFFEPYACNKEMGAFILIDPISNNTSAVGMILSQTDKTTDTSQDTSIKISLKKLGLHEADRPALDKLITYLESEGVQIEWTDLP